MTLTDHPAAPALPEGVQCIGCGYNLCGLTPDRTCPECGLLAGNSVITDSQSLVAFTWLCARVTDWQLQSALVLGMIVLIPTIIGTAVCMIAYVFLYFSNIKAIIHAPPMLRGLSSLFARWSDRLAKTLWAIFIVSIFLACCAVMLRRELVLVAFFYAVYVSYASTILGLGNALQAVNESLSRSRGIGPLSRWDRLLVAAVLLAALSAMLPLILTPIEARGFLLAVTAIVVAMALGAGAFHAIALQKPRRQLSTLIANSRAYLGTR